jgi:hypothetical protein
MFTNTEGKYQISEYLISEYLPITYALTTTFDTCHSIDLSLLEHSQLAEEA